MGYELPEYLTEWLNKEWRRPPQSFVNSSTFYAGLDVNFINYMNNVIRPCVAYSNGSADSLYNSGIKLNVGQTIKDAAVKLVKGDRVMLDGTDDACKALQEVWFPSVQFETFLESAIDYMLSGGTVAVKLNVDMRGRAYPCATRIDRFYVDTDEVGNVLHIFLLNSFLYSESYGKKSMRSYWLIEERYFNDAGMPCVQYRVHFKSGVVGQEILPSIDAPSMALETLPENVQRMLKRRGVKLDTEIVLPFTEGLGVWLWRRTAANSCSPGLAFGDPLVYGALDVLWACDVVFSGSITDVILGKGKILVPRKFLGSVRDDLKQMGIKTSVEFTQDFSDEDDTLVYIYTEHDKDFTPQSVQFEIRADKYKGMLDVYLQQAVTHCGFAPTSIFPFLQDASAKTATEVHAEENLTRASIQALHERIEPAINQMLAEVLRLYGFEGKVSIKLSDYVGNKIARDQNARENYLAGLTPKEVAVQTVNGISSSETEEYLAKLDEDEQKKSEMTMDGYQRWLNDNSEQTAKLSGVGLGGSGDENSEDNER